MQLTRDRHDIPKRWSAQVAVAAAVVTLQELVPLWEGVLPDKVFVITGAVLATLSVVMQAIKQSNLPER